MCMTMEELVQKAIDLLIVVCPQQPEVIEVREADVSISDGQSARLSIRYGEVVVPNAVNYLVYHCHVFRSNQSAILHSNFRTLFGFSLTMHPPSTPATTSSTHDPNLLSAVHPPESSHTQSVHPRSPQFPLPSSAPQTSPSLL